MPQPPIRSRPVRLAFLTAVIVGYGALLTVLQFTLGGATLPQALAIAVIATLAFVAALGAFLWLVASRRRIAATPSPWLRWSSSNRSGPD